MNIIIPDIDQIIVSLTELPALVNLGCVNKYFYGLVSNQPIIKQWLIIKTMHRTASIDDIFTEACKNGFLSYGMFLLFEEKIDIHADNESAFRWSCANGHIQAARWLINLGESEEYGKININANDEFAFRWSCTDGHIEIAHWLIQLGESGEYKKININIIDECPFRYSCINGNIEIANWLINLGESGKYGKIDQRIIDKYIKKLN